jgi:protease-4
VRPKIAALFVEGDIIDGKSQTIPILNLRFAGMQTLLPAIARARENPNVKALVVRIDSPGGSALASELINRELAKTAKVKPVLCSLGDVAASGGYFIAAACSKIFVAPSTLTGSIGIFTGKFDVSGLAAKLGVSLTTFERGRHASIESLYRPYTDEERALILDRLRYYYRRFVDAVARGREMKPEEIDMVARGRIWSGEAARARGLVDEYGGFADAVMAAKQEAGYPEDERLDLEMLPDQPSLLSTLLGFLGINLSAKEEAAAVLPGLGELLPALPGSLLLSPSTPQARLDEAWSFR